MPSEVLLCSRRKSESHDLSGIGRIGFADRDEFHAAIAQTFLPGLEMIAVSRSEDNDVRITRQVRSGALSSCVRNHGSSDASRKIRSHDQVVVERLGNRFSELSTPCVENRVLS